ncbi:Bin/amphiphysin/Rvs domain for vesicular trafficking-domain-containing protein [Phascolomyces articulosus]|uniref:Bin/amphiphysin/Rvs domain for vesicular trafficking-domain-containing protein n=1 Tax=Phascolomyces articulosus TaxID=60185 RepID=A0AAD5K0X3_9FUNG|nr:Bin/amphiphysin/Rvs domain for vesicular trafficking-domain-containing protein [Phascolomyces articulosus]
MAQPTDNLKVVDAEPQPIPGDAGSSNQALNPNVLLNNTLDGFATLSSKFNPFAQKLGKGIGQVRQYAQERLGTAEGITELPEEYKELEKRVDALRSVYVNLLKVSRTYNNPSYDYPVQLQESLAGIGNTFTTQFQNLALSPAERALAEQQQQQQQSPEKQHPKTLSHALSRVAATGSQTVGVEDALGTALFKVASISEKVGDARVNMDQAITTKFNQPMQTTLNTAIEQALKARRNVQSVRLSLDACKARYRAARPDRQDAAQLEVEQAEDQFIAAVEEATSLMKSALENPEPFRNLADLIAAQAAYFKEAHELLAELAPELDEIQVTQESLHRNRQE